MAGGGEEAMPRSFKLLDELEEEKNGKSPPGISIGLTRADDETLSEFTGSIVVLVRGRRKVLRGEECKGRLVRGARGGAQSACALGGRFLTLRVVPGDDYPVVAPRVQFRSKVNIPGVVDSKGNVDASKVPSLARWHPSKSMVHVLAELQIFASRAPGPQPPEDATFF